MLYTLYNILYTAIMHTHILTGGTTANRAKYIGDLNNPQTELIHVAAEKATLTIKQIKDLWDPLSIAPRLSRVVWIEEANLLTIPAQNALLKMLEEPPEGTSFYLTCTTSSSLLPTIRSRCKLIKLPNLTTSATPSTVLAEIKEVMALSPGDRLAGLVKRDRSESLAWVGSIEVALRNRLRDQGLTSKNAATLASIARLAQTLHAQLLANCSVSLATQVFLLSLPKTK